MHPAGEARPPSRVPRSRIVLMLIILGLIALLAVYSNVQRLRRAQVETVVVIPAPSPPAP